MIGSNDNQMIGFAIGNVISQYIPKLGMIAPILGIKIMGWINEGAFSFPEINITYVWILGTACIVIALGWILLNLSYIKSHIMTYWKTEPTSFAAIYDYQHIGYLISYMEKYPKYYDDTFNIDYGNPDTMMDRNADTNSRFGKYFSSGQKIKFNDTRFGLSGWIEIMSIEKTIKQEKFEKKITIKYPVVHVYKRYKINADDYIKKLEHQTQADINQTDRLVLKYFKVIAKSGGKIEKHRQVFFDGKKSTINERKEIYMRTFYHPEKARIVQHLDRIHYEPDFFTSMGQSGYFNAIFHGPAGTGKSSMVYRIAQSWGRHIVSLDLTTIKTKSGIYDIMQNFSDSSTGQYLKSSEVIILLEEFDTVFTYLKKKTEREKRKKERWARYSDYGIYDPPDVKTKKESKTPIVNGDIIGNENDKTDETKTETTSIDDFGNPEDFTLRDLLEILQGPVPREGQIVIATTNKFPELKAECPELFREGRLTPIYFGYLDANYVNDLIDVFFPNHPEMYIDYDPGLATSHIIEIANTARALNDTEYFNKTIKEASLMKSN